MKPEFPPKLNRAFSAWDRFGTRHIFLWMFSLAASTLIFRSLNAFQNSNNGVGWERNDGFSAFSISETLVAMSTGTILGLGFPILLTGPKGSRFLEHPARVLFTLFVSLTLLALMARAISASMSSVLQSTSEQAMAAGMVATGFVWAFYALIRARIGWLWRLAILLCCVSLANDFVYVCQITISTNAASAVRNIPYVNDPNLYAVVSIAGTSAMAIAMILAGVVELTIGTFRDWRTWITTMVLPICLILSQSPSAYELFRSYQIESLRIKAISFNPD